MASIAQNIEAVTLIPGAVTRNRAHDQTVEEWLEEYETGVPVIPAAWTQKGERVNTEQGSGGEQIIRIHPNACKVTSVHDFRAQPLKLFYQIYRTTQKGSLAVVLTDRVSELEYIAWFNIEKSAQRGSRNIKTGQRCYFYPKELSKFRKFWLKYICPTEDVWGSVYRRLPSRFRKLIFTGSAVLTTDSKGVEYFKVIDLRVLQLSAEKTEMLEHRS